MPNPFHTRQSLPGNIYTYFLAVLLLLALYLFYQIIAPFLHTILIAMVLAVIFSPVFLRAMDLCKGRRNLAAMMTVGLIVFVILLPLAFVLVALVEQGAQSLKGISQWVSQNGLDKLLDSHHMSKYLDWLEIQLPFIKVDDIDFQSRIIAFSQSFTETLLGMSTIFVRNATEFFLKFLLMIFILFYFLRDGIDMVSYLRYLSPLREEQEDSIIDSFNRVSKGVLMGCLLVAILQGLVGGLGLAMVGIPGIFWGAMMAFAALIPVLGTGLVWVPAVCYLLLVGDWKSALFLAGWCGIIVVGIDTFLRPYFMKEAARVSTFYIFMAILGGVYAFGMLGILYGPLILSFGMVMLQIYGEEYADILTPENGACKEAASDTTPEK